MRIVFGDSTRGYSIANIEKVGKKIRLVPKTCHGYLNIIKKCIATYNREPLDNDSLSVNINGDELPFKIED